MENAAGTHLLSHLQGLGHEISWWRRENLEVDFVVRVGRTLWAIEVKSGRDRQTAGLHGFRARHPRARVLLVAAGEMALEEFFASDPAELLRG